MANRDNVRKQDHLILEPMVAFRALEGHLVAVHHLLVRPQSVLGLELLVTHLTRSLHFWKLITFFMLIVTLQDRL